VRSDLRPHRDRREPPELLEHHALLPHRRDSPAPRERGGGHGDLPPKHYVLPPASLSARLRMTPAVRHAAQHLLLLLVPPLPARVKLKLALPQEALVAGEQQGRERRRRHHDGRDPHTAAAARRPLPPPAPPARAPAPRRRRRSPTRVSSSRSRWARRVGACKCSSAATPLPSCVIHEDRHDLPLSLSCSVCPVPRPHSHSGDQARGQGRAMRALLRPRQTPLTAASRAAVPNRGLLRPYPATSACYAIHGQGGRAE